MVIKYFMDINNFILIGFGIIGLVMLGFCIIATKGLAKKTKTHMSISIIMLFAMLIIFVSTSFLLNVWSFYIPKTGLFDDRYIESFLSTNPLIGMGFGIVGIVVLAYSTFATKKLMEKPKTRVGIIILMSSMLFALVIPFIYLVIFGSIIGGLLSGAKGRNRPVSGSIVADAMLFDGDAEKARLARKSRNFFD